MRPRININQKIQPGRMAKPVQALQPVISVAPNGVITRRDAAPSTPGNPNLPLANVSFPGGQFGAPIDMIRDLIKKQQRIQGFDFSMANARLDIRLDNLAAAKIFLGILIQDSGAGAFTDQLATLTINNEIVFQDLLVSGLSNLDQAAVTTNKVDTEYYSFPRPLSGQDEIILTLTPSVIPIEINIPGNVIVYYI